MKKLRFLLVLPVAALAWVSATALSPASAVAAGPAGSPKLAAAQGRIGKITWQGNTFLTTAQLNQALGLKPGNPYSKEAVDRGLSYRPDNTDVTSRYMDQGYLFFSLEPVAQTQADGTTNLTFMLSEGPVTRISSLSVKGNRKVATADILKLVPLHPGELFSRAKLMQSQRRLAESGYFDPTKIGINPRPNPAAGLVAIEYTVVEK